MESNIRLGSTLSALPQSGGRLCAQRIGALQRTCSLVVAGGAGRTYLSAKHAHAVARTRASRAP